MAGNLLSIRERLLSKVWNMLMTQWIQPFGESDTFRTVGMRLKYFVIFRTDNLNFFVIMILEYLMILFTTSDYNVYVMFVPFLHL